MIRLHIALTLWLARAKLRDIDDALAARLETIDGQLRSANKPADAEPAQSSQGMRGGGRHGGGMGGMGAGGTGGRHHRSGSGAGSGSGGGNATATNRLSAERTDEVRDALARALALLDPDQQTAAKKLLADRDVDVDTGSTAAPSAPSGSDEVPPEP